MHIRIIISDPPEMDGEPGSLPELIRGLDQSDLDDLSFLPEEHGFSGIGYWLVVNSDPDYDPATETLDEPIEYAVDSEQRVVLASRTVRSLTEEELAPRRAALKSYAAQKRWEKETGGVTVGGIPIPTDERTQGVLTAAYASAVADPEYAIDDWKVAPGVYASLDNQTIRAIAVAVRGHVQACFSLNRTVDQAIDAGEIVDTAGVDAAFA